MLLAALLAGVVWALVIAAFILCGRNRTPGDRLTGADLLDRP